MVRLRLTAVPPEPARWIAAGTGDRGLSFRPSGYPAAYPSRPVPNRSPSKTATDGGIVDLGPLHQPVVRYPTIFDDRDAVIDLEPEVVAYVVAELQVYSLLNSPDYLKGVAYEETVGSDLRGDRGEFFTPRNACRMAVTMLDPRPDERILDPSCDTRGSSSPA